MVEQIGNVISVVATVVMAIAACLALHFYRSQTRLSQQSVELEALIKFYKEIDDLWERYLFCEDEKRRGFHLGNMMAYYELMCYAFNKAIVGKSIENIWKDHLIEVFSRLFGDPENLKKIQDLRSGSDTYKEIGTFLRRHKKDADKHWYFQQAHQPGPNSA